MAGGWRRQEDVFDSPHDGGCVLLTVCVCFFFLETVESFKVEVSKEDSNGGSRASKTYCTE